MPQLGWCSVLASTQHTARTPLLPLSFQLNGLGLVGSADFADRDLDLGLREERQGDLAAQRDEVARRRREDLAADRPDVPP